MRICSIIGARPQFIKIAAIQQALSKHKGVEHVLIHTGQHFDHEMSQIFWDDFRLPRSQYHLNIKDLPHGAMTGRMMEQVEAVLLKICPDWVLVYGDTDTTLAAALAAKKRCLPLAHVEAGLRSYRMDMPEEINRVCTDRISDILFCPTATAVNNLKREGYAYLDCRIVRCGDVMLDTFMRFQKQGRPPAFDLPERFILTTLHRRANTGSAKVLKDIVRALDGIAGETPMIWPVHPHTRQKLDLYKLAPKHIHCVPPAGYLEMLYMLQRCQLVITDSGGLQKEAFFMKKPCVTMREETEWVELLDAGVNLLAPDGEMIRKAYKRFTRKPPAFRKSLYGRGNASERIVEELLKAS